MFLSLENAKSNGIFKRLLSKSKIKFIITDIDSSVINVEGFNEGAIKGYNPKKLGNRYYNIQFASL